MRPVARHGERPPRQGTRSELERRNELERLGDEARYRRERLELYRARLYGGRPVDPAKLRELERAFEGAAARLRFAESAAAGHRPGP
jgi:hypothetical protein